MKYKPRPTGVLRPSRSRRSRKPANNIEPDHCSADNGEAPFALTERESEVMKHLARGLLYKEIADTMSVSYAAVHKLQHKIFIKLQVSNRTEAVVKWRDTQL